jgi:uncharacterized protein YbbC (DUF1343 family)
MSKLLKNSVALFMASCFFSCSGTAQVDRVDEAQQNEKVNTQSIEIVVGAERDGEYLRLLQDKKVAVVANATSRVRDAHLVDYLLSKEVDVVKVFAPEHGFRGDADAGEHVNDELDSNTGLPIISLYGKNKKPSTEAMKGVDILLFDIQDVGVRFYTYLSTLHYIMEASAESGAKVLVLDRPNPNGFYIDGPVLEPGFESFIGLHPVPLVYGMTIGEYAQMINGEGWLKDGQVCDLTVVPCVGYNHSSFYTLPVAPSPNLPTMSSVYLYPSLALFEGTIVSVGRGTDFPFQVVGHPDFEPGPFSFTPAPNGGAKHPKLEGEECKALDLREYGEFFSKQSSQLYLFWLKGFYNEIADTQDFFLANKFFNKLAGNSTLMEQVKSGVSEEEIRASWQSDLEEFKKVRKKYLIYK